MVNYTCKLCGQSFEKKYVYERHLNRKTPCKVKAVSLISDKKYDCDHCGQKFTRLDNLKRHQKKNCLGNNSNSSIKDMSNIDFIDKITSIIRDEVKNEILQQTQNQNQIINNNIQQNILQVLCVGNNDNYLDMLTAEWGNFDKALEYIKDCALSSLTGDCKLLSKIYFDPDKGINGCPIECIDKRRGKIAYIDENNRKIVDPKGIQLGKRLANNLQNTYLKGINYLINKNLQDHCCPNKFLEEYDLQNWNKHIYDLSDVQYQRKIINHLEIPTNF